MDDNDNKPILQGVSVHGGGADPGIFPTDAKVINQESQPGSGKKLCSMFQEIMKKRFDIQQYYDVMNSSSLAYYYHHFYAT